MTLEEIRAECRERIAYCESQGMTTLFEVAAAKGLLMLIDELSEDWKHLPLRHKSEVVAHNLRQLWEGSK